MVTFWRLGCEAARQRARGQWHDEMSETGTGSILRRKAVDGRQEHLARSMPPPKALRLGLERAAEKGLALALDVASMQYELVGHEALAVRLDSQALLAVLDGDNGEPAALAIETQALAGLVEHATIGRVIARPAPGRVPTRVDAALVTPFVNDALAWFVALIEAEGPVPGWLQGYRFGAMAAGPRTLSLALTAHDYHLFEMDLSLAGGAKSGRLVVALPDCRIAQQKADAARGDARSEKAFQAAVKTAPAEMRAVLTRLSVPITRLQSLAVGDRLTVAGDAVQDTILESATGEEVARVQFGQVNGMRAVRLRNMGLPGAEEAAQGDGFVAEKSPGQGNNELDELLAAETALDALLPPVEDDPAGDDPTGDDLDGDDLSDLDDLIRLSAEDIGDPTALANLPGKTGAGTGGSAAPGDGV